MSDATIGSGVKYRVISWAAKLLQGGCRGTVYDLVQLWAEFGQRREVAMTHLPLIVIVAAVE